ncbi:sigma-70 family RNA polymerase sigma factor [Catellatospora bangladeshensis]|uniref:Sigma-70 family RNA polymerase sigma factor n=1 Tax=Catellatospora bangladeshensis TaxID=310355 RepID=A0A8J3JQ42_9ACTN|nr:sigma-70 family RNA polymerase sigma factor [Catellatospora bangladeshensis]GIF82758.1 hypothetical protein Cba03nite_41070 [Catellatospora bangladeshensis]
MGQRERAVPLVLDAVEERERHGYAILKRVTELSGGQQAWPDGVLYPLLHRLERLGQLTSVWRITETGRRRKFYRAAGASVSHPPAGRCSAGVERGVEPAGGAAVLSPPGRGWPQRRAEPVPRSRPGAVRPDLEQVFRVAYPRVVAVAARVLGSRDGAEDVAQEVFLGFGRSTVPAGEATGWLCVAAAHTALNHLRAGRRRATRERAVGGDGDCPDVADTVVARDEQRRVRAALARLPRKQAVALVLRHSGLSYAEVAAALDMSPGSVGTTVRRAESALRKELNRDASSD